MTGVQTCALPICSLKQLESNGTTVIPVAGTTTDTTMVFKAQVNDPDVGDVLKFTVELAPINQAFGGVGTLYGTSGSIKPGQTGTATIANIIGVSQSIEPTYKNLYAKANLSGNFIVLNDYLVEQLKERGLWDAKMVEDLKYYDGSVMEIDRVPADMKEIFRTSFEVDSKWLIACAARRQKWIDMGQSLNLYFDLEQVPEGKKNGRALSDMYFFAWEAGLKTTYYLRTLSATNIEKSTVDINSYGVQPKWMKNISASSEVVAAPTCSFLDPECEACQ